MSNWEFACLFVCLFVCLFQKRKLTLNLNLSMNKSVIMPVLGRGEKMDDNTLNQIEQRSFFFF